MEREPSRVLFADMRGAGKAGLLDKLGTVMSRLGMAEADLNGHMAAIKIHFGEKGNTAYIRPIYAARAAAFLKERGAKPFFTDTNTLYVGSRGDTVSHYRTAVENGFDFASVGAPVIIAGGLRGVEGRSVPIAGKHFTAVDIAAEIIDADIIVGLTHFKGHEMSGFGGALKNFGMGAAARKGKLAMHSKVSPSVKAGVCTGCRLCLRWCAAAAIEIHRSKAHINHERCVGCGACLPICPAHAIRIEWNVETADMQEKMAEHAWGALKDHIRDRAYFINFILNVSPLCDCYPFADAPIVPDIGLAASRDPVALDQACVDLVNASAGLEGSCLPENGRAPWTDKFRAIHPGVDWAIQLDHAAVLGLGTRRYALDRI